MGAALQLLIGGSVACTRSSSGCSASVLRSVPQLPSICVDPQMDVDFRCSAYVGVVRSRTCRGARRSRRLVVPGCSGPQHTRRASSRSWARRSARICSSGRRRRRSRRSSGTTPSRFASRLVGGAGAEAYPDRHADRHGVQHHHLACDRFRDCRDAACPRHHRYRDLRSGCRGLASVSRQVRFALFAIGIIGTGPARRARCSPAPRLMHSPRWWACRTASTPSLLSARFFYAVIAATTFAGASILSSG